MKRIIPALLCLAAASWLSYGSFAYVKEQTEKLCACVDRVLADEENAYAEAQRLCAKWEKVKMPFGSLLKHSDVDELGKYFIVIKDYADGQRHEELLEAAENCRAALLTVLEGEKPDIANIF